MPRPLALIDTGGKPLFPAREIDLDQFDFRLELRSLALSELLKASSLSVRVISAAARLRKGFFAVCLGTERTSKLFRPVCTQ